MPRAKPLEGQFRNVIYSPRGEVEGALIEIGGEPAQLVFDRHDDVAPAAFAALKPGQSLGFEATPRPPSDKGEAKHPVHELVKLRSVDGRPFKPAKGQAEAGYSGTVARLNFARHGEPNGVVLDSGDFIHTRPDGMARLKLKVGDAVRAEGDAQFLATGQGWAVEAWKVNGRRVHPD